MSESFADLERRARDAEIAALKRAKFAVPDVTCTVDIHDSMTIRPERVDLFIQTYEKHLAACLSGREETT